MIDTHPSSWTVSSYRSDHVAASAAAASSYDRVSEKDVDGAIGFGLFYIFYNILGLKFICVNI